MNKFNALLTSQDIQSSNDFGAVAYTQDKR